ncbi:MAG: hypothetical protein P8N02_07940 [Actinomycetota bacterium]|jgi:ABC-type glycerol-3-phosphate transport system substrate-binding protein|nr:hypothetical protein [Actinomycetota bacterium]
MREKSSGKWILKLAGLVVVAAMLLAACGDSDDVEVERHGEGTTTDAADSSTEVDLTEWEVIAESELSAGNITITAHNRGAEAHELVIVAADDTSDS